VNIASSLPKYSAQPNSNPRISSALLLSFIFPLFMRGYIEPSMEKSQETSQFLEAVCRRRRRIFFAWPHILLCPSYREGCSCQSRGPNQRNRSRPETSFITFSKRERVFTKPNFNTAEPRPAGTYNETLRQLVAALKMRGASHIGVVETCGIGTTKEIMERNAFLHCPKSWDSKWSISTNFLLKHECTAIFPVVSGKMASILQGLWR